METKNVKNEKQPKKSQLVIQRKSRLNDRSQNEFCCLKYQSSNPMKLKKSEDVPIKVIGTNQAFKTIFQDELELLISNLQQFMAASKF